MRNVLKQKEGKLWRETEIKIQVGQPSVNEDTQKIYICPFTGKVFGDNTHPNPQDAIYEPVKLKSIATLEKLGPKGQIVTWLGALVQRPEGQPKLVRDSDSPIEDFA